MSELTPERRAELRQYAEGVVDVEQTSMLAHPAEMLALLDAADERDKLAEQCHHDGMLIFELRATINRVRDAIDTDGHPADDYAEGFEACGYAVEAALNGPSHD